MEFKKDGCAYTVACDNKEQCDLLNEFLDDMRHDYRFIYVFVPDDEVYNDEEFEEYFNTLERAESAARIKAMQCLIDSPFEYNSLQISYTFYKMNYITWEDRIHSNDDVREFGTKIKEVQYTTKIKVKETNF